MQSIDDADNFDEYRFSYLGLGRSVAGTFYRKEDVDQRIAQLEAERVPPRLLRYLKNHYHDLPAEGMDWLDKLEKEE